MIDTEPPIEKKDPKKDAGVGCLDLRGRVFFVNLEMYFGLLTC